jgi:hypothetical protein
VFNRYSKTFSNVWRWGVIGQSTPSKKSQSPFGNSNGRGIVFMKGMSPMLAFSPILCQGIIVEDAAAVSKAEA